MLNKQVFNYSLKETLLFFYTISKWSIEMIGVMEAALTNLPVVDSYSIRNLDALSGSRFNARCKEIFGYILRKDTKGMKLYLHECYSNDLDTDLLVKKLNIAPFWSKYVNELHMNSQLHAESDRMKHCVRGYGDKVKTGMSRIFHISINGHSSTLELNMIVNNREDFKKILEKKPRFEMFDHFYNLQQHKAFGNALPHDLCWKVAHRLIAYLNHYNQYEIIIKNNNENRDRRDRRRQVEGRRRDELTRL